MKEITVLFPQHVVQYHLRDVAFGILLVSVCIWFTFTVIKRFQSRHLSASRPSTADVEKPAKSKQNNRKYGGTKKKKTLYNPQFQETNTVYFFFMKNGFRPISNALHQLHIQTGMSARPNRFPIVLSDTGRKFDEAGRDGDISNCHSQKVFCHDGVEEHEMG